MGNPSSYPTVWQSTLAEGPLDAGDGAAAASSTRVILPPILVSTVARTVPETWLQSLEKAQDYVLKAMQGLVEIEEIAERTYSQPRQSSFRLKRTRRNKDVLATAKQAEYWAERIERVLDEVSAKRGVNRGAAKECRYLAEQLDALQSSIEQQLKKNAKAFVGAKGTRRNEYRKNLDVLYNLDQRLTNSDEHKSIQQRLRWAAARLDRLPEEAFYTNPVVKSVASPAKAPQRRSLFALMGAELRAMFDVAASAVRLGSAYAAHSVKKFTPRVYRWVAGLALSVVCFGGTSTISGHASDVSVQPEAAAAAVTTVAANSAPSSADSAMQLQKAAVTLQAATVPEEKIVTPRDAWKLAIQALDAAQAAANDPRGVQVDQILVQSLDAQRYLKQAKSVMPEATYNRFREQAISNSEWAVTLQAKRQARLQAPRFASPKQG